MSDRLRPGARWWLAGILLISLCINSVGLGWGLPNGNTTWAADALQPMTPMAVAKNAFGGGHWNSGWFYFKYPLGHPLVLLAAQAPYLAWLRVSGQFTAPKASYPFGFRDPERALTMLALLTRAVSMLMGVGIAALAYVIASRLFSIAAGLAAAVLVAGCYPIVYYAHTTNVDVPMLFWTALAVAGTLLCADRDSIAAAVIAGTAAAMALLTKEASLGAIVAVPFVWLLRQQSDGRVVQRAVRCLAAAGTAFVAMTVLVGNVWWNPGGFVNRWRFLLGVLPAEVRDKFAPYQFQVQVPFSLGGELERVYKVAATVANALTIPVLIVCVVGAVWSVWRRPRQALTPLLLIAGFYLFSVRATALVQVRYVMPLLYFALILGGAAVGGLIDAARRVVPTNARRAVQSLLVAGLACALLPGIEVSRLLVNDPRYGAEAWLKQHAPASGRVEIYEPATYLPRFGPELQAVEVPVEERTAELFQQRRPDLVVLSSGGHAGLTGRYVRDWQPGQPIIVDMDSAKGFFEALSNEQLGYRRVVRFHTPTRWITSRINSLNPEISIFAPAAAAQAQ